MAKKTSIPSQTTASAEARNPNAAPNARAAKPPAADVIGKPSGAAPSGKAKPARTPVEKKGSEATAKTRGSRPQASATREEIALRAYFISERRRSQGQPVSPSEDWIAAERELAAEAGKGRKSGSKS